MHPSLTRTLASIVVLFVFAGLSGCSTSAAGAAPRKVLLIAGKPSHGPAQHEHNAGVLLLQKCLAGVPNLEVSVSLNGWPQDPHAFDGVAAVVIFCDGGPNHVALQADHLAVLDRVLATGAGFGLIHYAVEPTKEKGEAEFLRWAGGCFETDWSVNPVWTADFKQIPRHPIMRGVQPFSMRDEWYFNLRFVEGMKGVTPLLTAIPTPDTMSRKDGPHEGNPAARASVARGDRAVMSWAYVRPDGGRGFGFTGAHYHQNWGNENFRKVALNAIVWLVKMEVPAGGVASEVTAADLQANLDPKPGQPRK
jgi:hypothetical protein